MPPGQRTVRKKAEPRKQANEPISPGAPADGQLYEITDLSEYTPRLVTWLWRKRFPFAKVSMLDGEPDQAKSMLSLDLAVRVAMGWPMPGEPPNSARPPRGVVLVCSEDDYADTIVPRLMAAGLDEAGVKRIAHVKIKGAESGKSLPLVFPQHAEAIELACEHKDAALVIVDPVMGHLDEKINSGNDASVRRALGPLKDVAESSGAAIIMIRHFNKDTGASAINRGGGSIGFSGLARANWQALPHPEKEGWKLLARAKNNLSNVLTAYEYRVVESDYSMENEHGDFEFMPRIEWGSEVALTADDVLGKRDSRKDAPLRQVAADIMQQILEEEGPQLADVIKKEVMKVAPCSLDTVREAKKQLGVVVKKDYDHEKKEIRSWKWYLPEQWAAVEAEAEAARSAGT